MSNIIEKPRIGTKLAPEQKKQVTGALQDPMASMRALVKGSLFFFIQYFWDTYKQTPFVPAWHIERICSEIEPVIHRVGRHEEKLYDLVINVPPGTTKTAMVSIFTPIWAWVNYDWMQFISSSHSKDLSNESAEYSRNIIRSEKFQRMFPEIAIQEDKDVKSNFRVVKKEYVSAGRIPRIKPGGSRISTSVEARIMGFHGDVLLPDDLIDPRRAISEVGLKAANDHLATLYTRKTDKRTTALILIMQRLHLNDPTGFLMEQLSDSVRHICLPGELTNGYDEFVRPKAWKKYYKKQLLDPVRLGWKELKELESILGQYGYAGQVGQRPTPPGGGMFKPDRMAIVDHLTSRTNIVKTLRYWDKAATAEGGAYTAGVKMSLLTNKKIVVEDVVRKQLSAEDREAVMLANAQADNLTGPCNIHIEQEPGSGGKESAQSTIRNMAGFACFADRPTGKKEYRADPFSVAVNNGDVIMIKGDWNKAFREELELFGPGATFKDQVDAASAAYNILTGKREVRIIR